MAKGGVVMDVTNAEQARIAEQAGVSTLFSLFNPKDFATKCKTVSNPSKLAN